MFNVKNNLEQRMVILEGTNNLKQIELLNDILQETEELIKIFVRSIKTAEKKKK
jgi:hypothetical protein